MIDCGRHFEPIPVILRTLDGMEAVKLNVFHWHLTEDQGFRIESFGFPEFQKTGSDGLFYTQAQVREVVAYAHARGIRVVPEFDMPGHTTSWFVGYPDLASGPGPYTVQRRFGIHDAAIDPTRESTYKFLDAFLGEMAGLFPDAYMHIGGDESNGKQWMANAQIRAFMHSQNIKDTAGLQVYFNQRLLKILTKYHKHMVGWDEILTPGLPTDIVVQSWRGVDSLDRGATEGYQGILSAPYYLDAMKSAADHYLADPIPANSSLTPRPAETHLGRRGMHVGRADFAANHRLPHLASHSRHRRALLVACYRSRRSRHVPASAGHVASTGCTRAAADLRSAAHATPTHPECSFTGVPHPDFRSGTGELW